MGCSKFSVPPRPPRDAIALLVESPTHLYTLLERVVLTPVERSQLVSICRSYQLNKVSVARGEAQRVAAERRASEYRSTAHRHRSYVR